METLFTCHSFSKQYYWEKSFWKRIIFGAIENNVFGTDCNARLAANDSHSTDRSNKIKIKIGLFERNSVHLRMADWRLKFCMALRAQSWHIFTRKLSTCTHADTCRSPHLWHVSCFDRFLALFLPPSVSLSYWKKHFFNFFNFFCFQINKPYSWLWRSIFSCCWHCCWTGTSMRRSNITLYSLKNLKKI